MNMYIRNDSYIELRIHGKGMIFEVMWPFNRFVCNFNLKKKTNPPVTQRSWVRFPLKHDCFSFFSGQHC